MMNNISNGLWITALGMGLVFAAILVLWLMMIALTTLTADKDTSTTLSAKPASVSDLEPAPVSLTPGPLRQAHLCLRHWRRQGIASPAGAGEDIAQAAAVAVAMALADQETSSVRALPEPPTVIVSAWQLGMRSRLLAQKGNMRRHTK